ncbi:hypothetical protein Afil01_67900 [Actinorhabdospora filicis]|uniref:Uncharacterized protein n=1 Tax=Actinorhabdospora filicis TaxID=1785913 RepID=A0A9W6WDC9_9ACTN|nr:hypothetical protein [Actinorhabdospora filicis]GLZ81983.1 hypothetical protein Afil01_67900 [Actinorhabdospora filicis]
MNTDVLTPAETPAQDALGAGKTHIFKTFRTKKDNTMNLLNEALARARMRELWRDETRYVGRHRGAKDILLRARRRKDAN